VLARVTSKQIVLSNVFHVYIYLYGKVDQAIGY
jgi:hypothetical protein